MPERKKLLQGFKRFRDKHYNCGTGVMPDLVKNGADPDFFIIHCIDPRSGANMVFDTEPGALFGDRVMAALVPPYKEGSDFAASLAYAIEHKNIKHVIILGHTKCGGIEALVKGVNDKNISGWMHRAQKAFDRAKKKTGQNDTDALCAETEKQSVILGLKNLMTYPSVQNAFKNGDITLNGWLFNLEEGAVYGYDPSKNNFENLTAPPATKQSVSHKNNRP